MDEQSREALLAAAAELQEVLQTQVTVVTAVTMLVDREREAMAAGNVETLLAHLTRKEELLGRLASTDQHRARLSQRLQELTATGSEPAMLEAADALLPGSATIGLRQARERLLSRVLTLTLENQGMAASIDRLLGTLAVEADLAAAAAGIDRYDGNGRSTIQPRPGGIELSA